MKLRVQRVSWIIHCIDRSQWFCACVRRAARARCNPSHMPASVFSTPTKRGCARPWLRLTPLAVAVWAVVGGPSAVAQAPAEPLLLKLSPLLSDSLADAAKKQAATFMSADSMRGRTDLDTVLDGKAVLRKHSVAVKADRIEYYQPDDRVQARGNVRFVSSGNVFAGTVLDLRLEAFEGYLLDPAYSFLKNNTHGQAERIDWVDDKRAVIKNAWLTSCTRRPGPDWLPDWLLTASQIKLDTESDEGDATNAVLRFKGVPILATPRLNFPLSDARRNGFLPPSFSLDNISGLGLTQPYYMNIAPNRDATLEPTAYLRRGFDLAGQFRYLEADYKGHFGGNVMPHDKLRGTSRWGLNTQHNGQFNAGASTGIKALGSWDIGLDVSRVSDDNYWRDFPRASGALAQRLLPASVSATSVVGAVTVSAKTLVWQTLQDAASPITPPYDRLPQITASYKNANFSGFDVSLDGDFTRFVSDRILTGQPNASRAVFQAHISRPYSAPGWFVVPKAQLHATQYQFDAPLANGAKQAKRVLPTLSVDSGLVFERSTQLLGSPVTQTLEPRAFYVYTPYRDQSALPNYDSGANDFNFATVYTENAFGGNDRIADAHLLTLGTTSRFLNPATGSELMRLSVAQRLRFSDQNVTLPGGAPVQDRVSDLLLGAAVNWNDLWAFDGTVQYNQKLRQSERSTLGVRYSPGRYQVLNAAYRLQRSTSEQLDVSWQWPIDRLFAAASQRANAAGEVALPSAASSTSASASAIANTQGRWYGVGRINYSVPDRRVVDSVLGVEFDGDCWLARFVVERLQRGSPNTTGGPESNKRILFQLEFVGFSRLGNNPIAALQQNIPRYQLLRERISTPSRFSNYE